MSRKHTWPYRDPDSRRVYEFSFYGSTYARQTFVGNGVTTRFQLTLRLPHTPGGQMRVQFNEQYKPLFQQLGILTFEVEGTTVVFPKPIPANIPFKVEYESKAH